MAILRIYLFLLDSFQPSDISTLKIEKKKNFLIFYISAAAFGPNLYISSWKFESCPTG